LLNYARIQLFKPWGLNKPFNDFWAGAEIA